MRNDLIIILILGYGGPTPFSFPKPLRNKPLTNSTLCDFTNNFQHRRGVNWATNTGGMAGASLPSGPIYGIYHKNVGMIPNYSGHVPGFKFR